MTDEDGDLVHVQRFDAWGSPIEPASESADTATKNIRAGFTGHETDVETGLVNMRGRIYDPRLGRFLQADPITQAPFYSQSWNRYSYAFNNPLRFVDPFGFQSEEEEDGPSTFDEIDAEGTYQFTDDWLYSIPSSDSGITASNNGGETEPDSGIPDDAGMGADDAAEVANDAAQSADAAETASDGLTENFEDEESGEFLSEGAQAGEGVGPGIFGPKIAQWEQGVRDLEVAKDKLFDTTIDVLEFLGPAGSYLALELRRSRSSERRPTRTRVRSSARRRTSPSVTPSAAEPWWRQTRY